MKFVTTKSFKIECNHEWGYLDKEHRKCEICSRGEFLYDKMDEIEDWRKVYDPGNLCCGDEYEVDMITKKFFGGIK